MDNKITRWPINTDTIHNWINYEHQESMSGHSAISMLLRYLPENIKSAIRRACKRHHQAGTSAKAEAQSIASEYPEKLYFG